MRRFGMPAALLWAVFSGKNIYNFGVQKRLRAFLNPIFTGRGCNGKRQLPRWFPAETAARRGKPLLGKLISMVKVDSLLKTSLLSDTLNITNLIRRNETDHGCKNRLPSGKHCLKTYPSTAKTIIRPPIGPDYTPGRHLSAAVGTHRRGGHRDLIPQGRRRCRAGHRALVRGAHGVWSIWLPGEQHGRYYTFAVTVDGITRETGDPYARAAGVNGVRSMIVDLARTAPSGWERDVRPNMPPGAARRVGGERAGLLAGCRQRGAPGVAGQIYGVHPAGHHPARRRHPPHLPELPQAAGRWLCAADAHLRLWQRGRGKDAAAAVQLGLRPHQLQRAGGQLLHRPRPRRSPGAGVQADDPSPPRGGHRRGDGCGL